jgi:hypothetical protein
VPLTTSRQGLQIAGNYNTGIYFIFLFFNILDFYFIIFDFVIFWFLFFLLFGISRFKNFYFPHFFFLSPQQHWPIGTMAEGKKVVLNGNQFLGYEITLDIYP